MKRLQPKHKHMHGIKAVAASYNSSRQHLVGMQASQPSAMHYPHHNLKSCQALAAATCSRQWRLARVSRFEEYLHKIYCVSIVECG